MHSAFWCFCCLYHQSHKMLFYSGKGSLDYKNVIQTETKCYFKNRFFTKRLFGEPNNGYYMALYGSFLKPFILSDFFVFLLFLELDNSLYSWMARVALICAWASPLKSYTKGSRLSPLSLWALDVLSMKSASDFYQAPLIRSWLQPAFKDLLETMITRTVFSVKKQM